MEGGLGVKYNVREDSNLITILSSTEYSIYLNFTKTKKKIKDKKKNIRVRLKRIFDILYVSLSK